MPVPEITTTFVMLVWTVQCVGLGVLFALIAAEFLVRSEGNEEERLSARARPSRVIDVEWRYADRPNAHR